MRRFATLAVFFGVLATVYAAACVLPGEPSGVRIRFSLDSTGPYRVPLAGVAEPLITISADGQVLKNPSYRLETLDAGVVRVDSTERRLRGLMRGTAAVRVTYLGATGTPDTVFPVEVVISRVAVDSPALAFTRLGVRTRLSAIALDANNAPVPNVVFAWSSLDPTVAAVNDTGLVTAVDEGSTTITAEADGVADTSDVTVTQVAAMVRVAPKLDTLRTLGRSIQLVALAFDSNSNFLYIARPRWTNSDSAVVRVDATGRATAEGTGTARIVARVGAAADTATLVVAQVVRLLLVTPGFDTLTAIGDTTRVVAVALDSSLEHSVPNPSLGWVTSDAAVATVDQAGLVRAVRNGVVLVTASAVGQSAFATVVVRQEVATAQIVQDKVALTGAGDTVRLSAMGLDRNGYPVAGAAFAWRSGLSCVATVDTAGLVTAGGEGSAAIIATLANGGQSDTAVVSVAGAPSVCLHSIAFQSTRDGNYEIYVMDADGSNPLKLTNTPEGSLGPVWSPDGRKIAFLSYADGNPEIYVMNADGSGPQNLTNNPSNDYLHAWSPDGTKIAFMSDRDGHGEIYVMNADGSGLVDLTSHSGIAAPAWSPNGTRIAFASDHDGYRGISLMNADGSGLVHLTRYPGRDDAPMWSPDGTKIAFYRERIEEGGFDICVMNADGSGVLNLTSNSGGANNYAPVWSPDGTKIAFYGFYDIYVMNADGSARRNLTNNLSTNYDLVWSPDGTKVAFQSYSDRDGNAEIYLVNADGSGLINITNNPGGDSRPAWRRR